MDDYNGLYHTNPKLSLVMMLALFSLAGIPPVAGFFGKFFLFTAAADKGIITWSHRRTEHDRLTLLLSAGHKSHVPDQER